MNDLLTEYYLGGLTMHRDRLNALYRADELEFEEIVAVYLRTEDDIYSLDFMDGYAVNLLVADSIEEEIDVRAALIEEATKFYKPIIEKDLEGLNRETD